jgi:hypothetical protein
MAGLSRVAIQERTMGVVTSPRSRGEVGNVAQRRFRVRGRFRMGGACDETIDPAWLMDAALL